MLQPWPTFRNVLLLLFGVQLSIAAFFLFPSYVEYAHDTQHLGVDLHHILVGDRFTNVGAAFCVLYPIPVLCSFGRVHSIRPLGDSVPDSIYGPLLSHTFTRPAGGFSPCRCLSDALVNQHIFFGQLEFSSLPIERIVDFLVSFPMSRAASQFARDGASPGEDSSFYGEVDAMLGRVDAALDGAHRAVTQLAINIEFAFSRARFAHHTAFSGLKIANYLSFFNLIRATDDALRRAIEYVVLVAVSSSETVNMDLVVAVSALNTLLNAITVDSLDTLLRTYSSFTDHRQAISHCATSASYSPICSAVETLLQSASMVESMRDDLASLKDTVKVCSKHLDGHLICATTPQQCTLDRAFQIFSSSESYLVGRESSSSTNGDSRG